MEPVLEEPDTPTEPHVMLTPVTARESLYCTLVFSPRDFSLDARDAWTYGIIVGWGDALGRVAARHEWGPEECARLANLHDEFWA